MMPLIVIVILIALSFFVGMLALLACTDSRNQSDRKISGWIVVICAVCFSVNVIWATLSAFAPLNFKSEDFYIIQEVASANTTVQFIMIDNEFIRLDYIFKGYISNPKQHGIWVKSYYDCNYGLCYKREKGYEIHTLTAEK